MSRKPSLDVMVPFIIIFPISAVIKRCGIGRLQIDVQLSHHTRNTIPRALARRRNFDPDSMMS